MKVDTARPVLEARGLRCEREARLLFENLSFSLGWGEVLQVKGPNGSGKTTLLRSISGLSQRCRGEILWHGEPLDRCRHEFMGDSIYLGHDTGIKLRLSAVENLRWQCALWSRCAGAGIVGALSRMGLATHMEMPTLQLSAGQRRRAALARLLLSPARLWILDEPFTAIDADGVRMIEDLIAEHVNDGGAVMLVTHHALDLGLPVKELCLGRGET